MLKLSEAITLMIYYKYLYAIAFLFICLSLVASANAQANLERETLVGLTAVRVVVESLSPELERAGVAREQIQTDVELRLRKAGIRVIDYGSISLYVNINSIKEDDYSFAYSISIQLNQPVILERDKAITALATTWEKGLVGFAGISRLQSIRDSVGNLVDMFINDYLAVASQGSTFQGQPTQTSRGSQRIDISDDAIPSNMSFQSPSDDVGIDIARVTASKANLREAPNSPIIVLQPVRGDLLALIDRMPKGTWYNVVHVSSGKEGWIDGSVINIKYTKNPKPAPVFEEKRVESNKDPELVVQNQTDRLLSLRLGDSLYSVPALSEKSFSVPAGTYKFYASVPSALPALGEKYFSKGIIFTWKFYIVTRRR